MNLEKKVCSLELAKKLKELGIKSESLYVFYQKMMGGDYYLGTWNEHIPPNIYSKEDELISAFTVAELGDMLLYKECSEEFEIIGNIYENTELLTL